MKNETFLNLSAVDWSAISTVVTFLVVLVALFLPLYFEKKKEKNLSRLIEYELASNIRSLKEAIRIKQSQLNGITISKIDMMCAIIVSRLDLDIWNDNKQTIAEISSKKFLKYSAVAKMMKDIKSYANDIKSKKGQSLYVSSIEEAIEKCLKIYDT